MGLDKTGYNYSITPSVASNVYNRTLGKRQYEAGNHLGNVLATVSDYKKPNDVNADALVDFYYPQVISSQDYYPFGAPMKERTFSSAGYRYGFNGQEKSDEIAGAGNHNTAEYWEYDTRLGRRWNLDPFRKPWQSDYSALSNSPIWRVDPDGDDDFFNKDGSFSYSTKKGSKIFVQTDKGNKLLTEVSIKTSMGRQTVANVVGYYATQIGVDYTGKGEKSNKRAVGLQDYPSKKGNEKEDNSDKTLAFTDKKNILINTLGGKINSDLFDVNNLKAVLGHENDHKLKGHGFKAIDEYEHAEVTLVGIMHPSFSKGTKDFQMGQIGALADYLGKAASFGYSNDDINKIVKASNAVTSKLGYKLIPQFYQTSTKVEFSLSEKNKK
jgi:hypothetical protein